MKKYLSWIVGVSLGCFLLAGMLFAETRDHQERRINKESEVQRAALLGFHDMAWNWIDGEGGSSDSVRAIQPGFVINWIKVVPWAMVDSLQPMHLIVYSGTDTTSLNIPCAPDSEFIQADSTMSTRGVSLWRFVPWEMRLQCDSVRAYATKPGAKWTIYVAGY
ncbi:MAG: hypothetical protein ACE5D3_01590 [Candidatus Binatia bacterium]